MAHLNVSEETWRRLNRLKRGQGDTFDDVITRLLDETEMSPHESAESNADA